MKGEEGSLVGRRIALTGATGFIGGLLLRKLLVEGAQVIALTRNVDRPGLLQHDHLEWVAWNLDKPKTIGTALEQLDAVFHLAAHIPKNLHDISEAEICLRRNGLGTLGLLEAAHENGISFFLNVSAGQLYSPGTQSPVEHNDTFPSGRASAYLTSKLVGEIFVDHYGRLDGFKTINLRVGSPYGPGMSPKSVVLRFIDQALKDKPLSLFSNGMYSIDLVFVEDVVNLIPKAFKDGASGIFNVGSGSATTIRALAQEIVRLTGSSQRLIEFVPGPSDPGYPALDIGKTQSTFGYSPTPLQVGLTKVLAGVATEGTGCLENS